MRIKKGFVLRDVCGEQVIMGEGLGALDFGKLISLNESGALLWKAAVEQGDFTVESLAKVLADKYDVTKEQALADVAELMHQWREAGVLE